MTSYIAASARGRENARAVNARRLVTVDRYTWKLEPRQVYRTFPACPPFTTEPTRRWVDDGEEWNISVVADCGHTLFYGHASGDGVVDYPVALRWPVGKRKRCPKCPLPERKPPPPDGERCVYEVGGEAVRQCATRARWKVSTVLDGVVQGHAWPLLCERHRKHLAAEGYIGQFDVIEPARP